MKKPGRLQSAEFEKFQQEGYVTFHRPVLGDRKFQALKSHFEELCAALKPGERPELMDVPHFTDT